MIADRLAHSFKPRFCEITESLLNLFFGVHHERTAENHRLAERRPAEQKQPARSLTRTEAKLRDALLVGPREPDKLTKRDGDGVYANIHRALDNEDKPVVRAWERKFDSGFGVKSNFEHEDRDVIQRLCGELIELDQPPSSDPGEILVQHDAKGRG
jgi:hypothetical protein